MQSPDRPPPKRLIQGFPPDLGKFRQTTLLRCNTDVALPQHTVAFDSRSCRRGAERDEVVRLQRDGQPGQDRQLNPQQPEANGHHGEAGPIVNNLV